MFAKKWIAICLLLLLASQQLSAQTGRELTGKVVDEAREAIVGAVVTCTSGNDTIQAATTTDADGRFSISVGGDSVCIEFSHLTYETRRLVTDARGGDMGEVVLAEKENRLDEVVSSRRSI